MTEQPIQDNTPIIPPFILLAGIVAGLLVAFGSAFINNGVNFVFFAGIIVALLCAVFWAVMNPDIVKQILRGRFFAFGGTAVVVTIVVAVAFTLVYILVREAGLRADLSEGNNFSLSDNGKQVVQLLGSDPTTPPIVITAFFNASQASTRDRAAVILDEIQRESQGKISYRFVDPDRDPLTATRFQNATSGQVAVSSALEDGSPDPANTTVLPSIDQQALLDALVTATAKGDFRAYFLNLSDGLSITDEGAAGMSILVAELTDKYKWQVQSITMRDLETQAVNLNEAVDGSTLIIAGGQTALPDAQLKLITDYVDAGGSLVLMADFNATGQPSLATAPNLNTYLSEKFGITINNDLVLDPKNSDPQSPTTLYVTNYGTSSLTASYDATQDALFMLLPHSISVASTLPAAVTVTTIASTSPEAYAKANLDFSAELTNADLQQTSADPTGALAMAVEAENVTTGARVIVFGSPSIAYNQFRQYDALGLRNFDLVRRAIFWTAKYENFAQSIAELPTLPTAQQTPVIADDSELTTINLVAVFLLPFGVLLAGIAVWWTRRERAIAL
jgi:hypothetical protein